MSLATVAAVVGIGAGVNSIYQSNKNKPGGGGGTDAAADAADPFKAFRGQFGSQLSGSFDDLTKFDPEAIKKDPAYQFQLDQGTHAIDKGAAASGMLGSGTRMMDLEKYGQGLASSFTDKQFGRNMSILQLLGQFSGATTGSPGAAGNLLNQGNTNSQNQLNGGLGNIMSGLGGLSRGGFSLGGGSGYGGDTGNGGANIWAGSGYGP